MIKGLPPEGILLYALYVKKKEVCEKGTKILQYADDHQEDLNRDCEEKCD